MVVIVYIDDYLTTDPTTGSRLDSATAKTANRFHSRPSGSGQQPSQQFSKAGPKGRCGGTRAEGRGSAELSPLRPRQNGP